MEQEKLILLYWERKESAIQETQKEYGSYCKQIAYHILRNRQDTEECMNDTYLNIWNSIPPQKPICFRAYIAKITRNLSLNRLKARQAKKRRENEVVLCLDELEDCIGVDMVERHLEEKILVEKLNEFLARLSEQDRNLFIRRYFFVYSITELAKGYHMTAANVSSSLFQIRAKLKQFLKEE